MLCVLSKPGQLNLMSFQLAPSRSLQGSHMGAHREPAGPRDVGRGAPAGAAHSLSCTVEGGEAQAGAAGASAECEAEPSHTLVLGACPPVGTGVSAERRHVPWKQPAAPCPPACRLV